MEEASRLVARDRKAEPLTVIPAPSVLPWDQMPREPHLLDYFIILRKHQWLVLTFLLTVVTVVTIASFKMKPVYQAAARVEVDRESQSVLPFQGPNSYDEAMDMENYIETQSKILQSETLALQTIKSMDLGRYPEFGGSSDALAWTHGGLAQKRPAILSAFLGRLSVKRVPTSRLIEVQFEAEDAQLAAQVVNSHLQNYIEQNFRSKYDATTQASNWLSAELEELRIKVERSEDARIAYERQNQIWRTDEKQDITTEKLGDLSKAVTDAQTGMAEKEALYRMAIGGNVDALPAAQTNSVMQELLKHKTELDEQYLVAVDQYGPNYPKVLRLEAQIKELNSNLDKARKTLIESVEQDFNTARSRVELLQQNLDRQKAEANDLAEKLVQYQILAHDAESNKQLYDGLLQKLKEAGITAGLRSSNIRVVDPALTPSYPVAASEGAKHHARVPGRTRRRNWARAFPRVSRQHREISRRHRSTHRPAVAGRRAFSSRLERTSQPPDRRSSAANRSRPAGRAAFLRAAQVANLRSIPRAAHFALALAGRSSSASDSCDQRIAS